MDLELHLRGALVLEDTSDDFIARVMARVDNPEVIDIRSRRRNRLIVVGTLAVVGIAAAMFIGRVSGPEPGPVDALRPPDALGYDENATPALERATSEQASEIPLSAAEPEAEEVAPAVTQLPLVPAPVGAPPDPDKSLLVLQKAVERHPEIVQGPELDDTLTFLVSMTMRTDGRVINSAAELASPATYSEISRRVSQTRPGAAGERFNTGFGKGSPLPDGSELRARVSLSAVFIDDSFDLARSDVRVREILGQKYDELMTTASGDEFNLVTVFLSEDGRILREKVERVTMQNAGMVMGLATGARQEETIADSLGIAVEQIGEIGMTTLQQGSPREGVDQHGANAVGSVRMLGVRYAWARPMEEPAVVQTPRRTSERVADFDLAAAQVVAERLLPDAFSHAPLSVSEMAAVRPTVVFTAKGEVIRAGRVQMRNGVDLDSLLQEQLVPGVPTRLHRSLLLTNDEGATAVVDFAWEK